MTLNSLLKKKIIVLVLLSLWGGLPYHLIQNVDFSMVMTMPMLKVDHWIPINLHTVWIYHSWLFLPFLTVLLIPSYAFLKRYAWSVFGVNAVSFAVFLCYPTMAPRPADIANAPGLYLLTIQMDKPLNACPSLHASITLLCSICCIYLLLRSRSRARWIWCGLMVVWAVGILWSTLATGQHVFLDIVAGSLLGATTGVVALLSLPQPQVPRVPIPRGMDGVY